MWLLLVCLFVSCLFIFTAENDRWLLIGGWVGGVGVGVGGVSFGHIGIAQYIGHPKNC